MNQNTLCIIVPCYNEEECIEDFVVEVKKVAAEHQSFPDYKILFVNDGSGDASLKIMQKISKEQSSVEYISFSRNFGKEAAIYAGLDYAYNKIDSQYYVLMDADLQDPPALLPEMIDEFSKDKELSRIGTRRVTRKGEPPIRSLFARMFYRLMNKFSQVELVDGARDYQMMTRQFTKALLDCGEYNRFFKGLSQWVGFKTKWLEFENVERAKGETKWSFWGLFAYSVEGILAYSTWPLRFISVLGVLLSFIAVIFLFVVLIKAICVGDPVAGWPSLTCIILFIGGLLTVGIGIIGLYLEKTYLEVKRRPIYIVEETSLQY